MSENLDYVPHGSKRHAEILGLIEDKSSPLGYRLADITAFGPQATQAYLDEVLRQKITSLKNPPAVPQATDPKKPNFAQPMWTPENAK